MTGASDDRLHSPAAQRNSGPILAELQRLLPAQATVLEIASGSGQHAAHFASAQLQWRWLPTDGDPRALVSIAAWCSGLANVLPPRTLDVTAADWPGVPAKVDAIFCANLLHIAPWAACAGLMQGAGRHLATYGQLLLYGPYVVDGEPTAASNCAFDDDLRARDPRWGLRKVSDVLQQAEQAGLRLRQRVGMPANNQLLVMERTPGRAGRTV